MEKRIQRNPHPQLLGLSDAQRVHDFRQSSVPGYVLHSGFPKEPDHLAQQQKPKTYRIYSLELSKMRGQAKTVVEGKNGFLIPRRDVDALVTALEYFIQNPDAVKSMGQASRMLAESRYDVNLVTAEMFQGMKLDSSIFE